MQLQKPDYLLSLASAGILVNVECSTWGATKKDNKVTEEVTSAYKSDKDSADVVVNLMANVKEHKEILKYRNDIRNWLRRWTYDWAGSLRYLPTMRIEKFKQEFDTIYKPEFTALTIALVNRYEDIVAEMAFKNGDLFKASDYPSKTEVEHRFKLEMRVIPVPANDFRVQVAQDIADDLKQHYENNANEMVQDIMRDVTEDLTSYIKRVAASCTEPEEGKRKPKVYDSTIEGLKELTQTLSKFNVTNDSVLESMRKEAEQVIGNFTAKDIRDSEAVRSSVKNGMDDILSKFGVTLA
jgi:hypothetical protein